mgnify:CR=1 FL=1
MEHIQISDLNILMVEPSDTQRKIISSLLIKENVSEIDAVSTVAEAKSALRAHGADVVVSAMYFEDGTALDLVKCLKSNEKTADIPFMLVSSECRKEQLEAFRQSGVIAILPKPFTPEHLGTAINATIDILGAEELELSYFDVKSLRVLVVDDSRFARKFVSRVLNSLGIERITEVADGSEAIEIIKNRVFDLVVTDYNMPEVNGRELTEFIRQESDQSHIPVLMVSSEANETHLSNIEQSGVNAMCDKPFEPENVRKILYNLLEGDE